MTEQRPQGLLSFVYDVTYNPSVQADFHKNEIKVMNEYGIEQGAQDLIRAIGADQTRGATDKAAEGFRTLVTEYLVDEVNEQHLALIW